MSKTCVLISIYERDLLEKSIFNGYKYSRKRTAYLARAEYYSPFDLDEWELMLSFYDYKCCRCFCEVIGGRPTKDHIIPITLGGTNSIRNLQPLCRQCNSSKTETIDYRHILCDMKNIELPKKWIYE